MASVSLDRLIQRLLSVVDKVEVPMLQARYDFPVTSMKASDRKTVMDVGGQFVRFLIAWGVAKGRLDPTALDEEFAGGLFVSRATSIYGQYGGFSGAVSIAKSGEEGGLQEVFTKLASAMASEMSKNNVAYIFSDEVDELDFDQVKAISQQLKRRIEGLRGVPIYQVIMGWKELVLYLVQQRRSLGIRFGQQSQDA